MQHDLLWRMMATYLALEIVGCMALWFISTFGIFHNSIANLHNVPDCDFACFRRVFFELTVLRVTCLCVYLVSLATAVLALCGFFSGSPDMIALHVVVAWTRGVVMLLVGLVASQRLMANNQRALDLSVALTITVLVLNVFSASLITFAYLREKEVARREDAEGLEPLRRPLSGHSTSWNRRRDFFTWKRGERQKRGEQVEPCAQTSFFQRPQSTRLKS